MIVTTDIDRDLLRLHRRACTDFAARMRLPAREHLTLSLAEPLAPLTVGDLLVQVANGNLRTAATLSGQPAPSPVTLSTLDTKLGKVNTQNTKLGKVNTQNTKLGKVNTQNTKPSEVDTQPSEVVVESIRTVLTVCSVLASTAGLSPSARDLLWNRTAELTVLGYDLQQAIHAGAGLDELLVDRLLCTMRDLSVWPYLPPQTANLSTPPQTANLGTPPLQHLLALTGRPVGLWMDTADLICGTGQC